MKHLTEGEMRAYWDRELSAEEQERTRMHLEGCTRCREHTERLQSRHRRLTAALSALDPPSKQVPLSPQAARLRLEDRIEQGRKENESMFHKLTHRLSRPVWAVLATLALLAGSMAFAPVRAAAGNFLSLFRVQQVTVIPVDTEAMNGMLANSSQLESFMANDVQFETNGESQVVSGVEEASQAAGFAVRLPDVPDKPMKITVQPGGHASFTIDVKKLNALLEEIDRTDIQLPDSADGSIVELTAASAVLANYGDCEIDAEVARQAGYDPDEPNTWAQRDCIAFAQTISPEVNAPDGLDMQALGTAFLQLVGMSEDDAADLAGKIDWATTLVLPIPSRQATATEVQVDGVTGTLIRSDYGDDSAGEYSLVWVKGEMVYMLTGRGSGEDAVGLANTLK